MRLWALLRISFFRLLHRVFPTPEGAEIERLWLEKQALRKQLREESKAPSEGGEDDLA